MGDTQVGWRHFAAAEWAEARDSFAAVLAEAPGDPDALDGLGQSLWWLGERDGGHRQPPRGLRGVPPARRPPRGGAAWPCTWRASTGSTASRRPRPAGSRGRAACSTDAGTVAELGWLRIEEAKRSDDPAVAERFAREALAVAHELADPDIECMALAQLGRAVVRQGRVEEGVGLLDEAMTVALGGETSDPLACGDACCTTLVVCDGLADLQRAAEWCEAVVEFAERRRFTPLQSWCRAIFGAVLVRSGEWARAEQVLTQALERKEDRRRGARPGPAARGAGRPAPAAGADGGGRAPARRPRGRERRARPRSCSCTCSAATSRLRGPCSSAAAGVAGAGEDCSRSPVRLRSRRATSTAPASLPRRCGEAARRLEREDLRAEAQADRRSCRARARRRRDGRRGVRGRPGALRPRSGCRSRRRGRGSSSRARSWLPARRSPLATARTARDAFERLGRAARCRRGERAAARPRRRGPDGRTRRARRADGPRARGARPGRGGPLERRDRPQARDLAEDRRAPRRPRARQARRAQPRRGGCARRARRARVVLSRSHARMPLASKAPSGS